MAYLLDTNVLVALLNRESPLSKQVETAITRLASTGEQCWLAPQIVVEFRAVATRPVTSNGLGWSPDKAAREVRELLKTLPVMDETPDLLPAWLDFVATHSVSGKHVHDARLAVLMKQNQIIRILTFNTVDFPAGWGVTAVEPS